MSSRKKMCLNKVSFFTKKKAQAVAEVHSQRVYECPICFCWHCTSKEDWKSEYVDAEYHKKELLKARRELRTEYNQLLSEKNRKINKLELKIKRLKMGYDDEDELHETA